ncbi:MFS transporter [Coxiella burnetii]|uniref:Transporter, MFS superfamily n=1 Tax=Coxiella burnetii (strain RSA 493 / Nine Mile phase I) TaxID=227377 RepID=Q83EP3_COXBU|nr:MFS transporter [Coxiella burnetii]NP_819316.1 MFS superfamily transporter [Coxiella burnetii RSA 493]AAO89830.1 transporter, MFS superfamily [Coxiella burnetii RSA 493]ARI65170.1 MFS transporter [Coxiella burnetii]ARK26659.1 MFS transporter [Coxiella burnetii]ATN73779.1 MFS transporter [Coxiella burnetii]ATN75684.1 MFS transporter [Coxiella burnetii]
MHTKERSAVTSLAAIMSFRMLGLFMLLPVFALYVNRIPYATPALIGVAIGVYGLMQAFFQIPFGMLSDRIGRKPIIAGGLLLLGVGSAIAAFSHSIYGIIFGRALQGAGAIGSTVLAMIADLTRDEERSKAMALVGMTIGFSFAVAIILGPIINTWFHLEGIFWATLAFAILGLILLFTVVPTPPQTLAHPEVESEQGYFKNVLRNTQLLRLDFGIFSLHCILTAMFIGIPIMLSQRLNLTEHEQVLLYLIIMALAFIAMMPLIIVAEKKRQLKPFFIISIVLLIACQLSLLFFHRSVIQIGGLLFVFFTAFTLLEASLPSWISKIAPIRHKGTAMGVYSSAQFFGIFIGGSVGGWVFGHFHLAGLFFFCAAIGFIWLLVALTMQHPPYFSTVIVKMDDYLEQNLDQFDKSISKISGVAETAILRHENLIYFKIDKKIISEDELRKRIRQSNLKANRN